MLDCSLGKVRAREPRIPGGPVTPLLGIQSKERPHRIHNFPKDDKLTGQWGGAER